MSSSNLSDSFEYRCYDEQLIRRLAAEKQAAEIIRYCGVIFNAVKKAYRALNSFRMQTRKI